ncbi:bcl2-associated agonist of cell death [Taeniopygia guttata]|uniref:bcl2-associated agonist of cell death n=1 Tax=Taeniopygia guttata TaxID=59729 RepID=UPI003BB8A370
MLRLDETPEDRGSPPPSPWGGSPSPSQPGTPSPEARPRLLSERGGAGGGGDPQIGAPPGDPPPARGRSRSAPPVLWAAQRYGRRLRRMSDEFQLQVLPRPRSVGGAPPGGGGWRETLRAWWGSRRPRPAPPGPPP